MAQFTNIALVDIVKSTTNPRKHFDEKQLKDLTESIRTKGVINPLLVRPIAGGGYELIAGERRYRACQALELSDVPAIVRDLTDEEALEIQVIENLQRADVHPLDEAEGYKQLMAKNKYDQAKIAEKVGKSVVYVYQRLQLAQLIDGVKKLFWEDKITVTHAIHIARLDAEGQKKVSKNVEQEISWRGTAPSIKNLIDFIKRNVFMNLSAAPWKKDDAELYPSAGACAQCPKRTGFNKTLFDDMGKADMCLDAVCFKHKGELLVERKVAEAKDEGQALVKVSTSYSHDKGADVLSYNDFSIVSNKEAKKDNVRKAIVANGDDLGKVIFIKLYREVKEDGSKGLSESEKLDRAKKRVANQKREIDRKYRISILKAIVDKVNTKLFPEDLKVIAAQLMRSLDRQEKNMLHDELALDYKDHYGAEDLASCEGKLPKSEFEIAKLLMMLSLASSVNISEFNTPNIKPLLEAAGRYKIDDEEIRAVVEKENPIKWPKILLEQKEKKAASKKNPAGKASKKGAANAK